MSGKLGVALKTEKQERDATRACLRASASLGRTFLLTGDHSTDL